MTQTSWTFGDLIIPAMMKLACVRCKRKKVKCDKAEGTCHQCIIASTECVYAERRKRRRMVRPDVQVGDLSRRLENIERHIGSINSPSPSTSHSVEDSVSEVPIQTDTQTVGSPESSPPAENGPNSWIYRLASETKSNFEKINTPPAGTPAPPGVDTVMSSLSEALDALGRLRIRYDETIVQNHKLDISIEEGKASVKEFINMSEALFLPALSELCGEFEVLHVMPEIISSPYIDIDPCIRVLYYNALYYGLYKRHGPGNDLAQTAYYKLLESVPAWLAVAKGTNLDIGTAGITTWTTIANFDYQLAWKFHCKACQFICMRGIDKLDVDMAKTHKEENRRQGVRFFYFCVLQTDLLFRLFLGKPAVLKWSSTQQVKLPSLFINDVKVNAPQAILYIVSLKYTVMTAEILNFFDEHASEENSEETSRKVTEYCEQIEGLAAEWDLDLRSRSSEQAMYADLLLSIYASIIGIKRLTRSANSETIDATTLRAARRVIDGLLQFTEKAIVPKENGIVLIHFISFYPFCTIFTIYSHILSNPTPSACESDLESLISIETLLQQASTLQKDLTPFANVVKALNRVCKVILDRRRDEPQAPEGPDGHGSPSATFALPPQQSNFSFSTMDIDAFQSLAGLDFPDFGINEDLQPLDVVRALESDFIGRNWHETWWDMGEGMNGEFQQS